jgi:hypothetical protein
MLPPVRPIALEAPGEWLFAVLMAASPIVGSFWVTPDVTRWIVFGIGVLMVLGTVLAGLRPVEAETPT